MAGRPKYEPTPADRNTVKTMASAGFDHVTIAKCLGTYGIDGKTLRKHFRRELDTSMAMSNAQIAGKLYATALAGNVSAMTFWLKCRARWQEVVRYEHSGPEAGPMQLSVTNDGESEKDAFARRIIDLAERARPKPDPGADDGSGSTGA